MDGWSVVLRLQNPNFFMADLYCAAGFGGQFGIILNCRFLKLGPAISAIYYQEHLERKSLG